MTIFKPGTKVLMEFTQGTIGSKAPVDIGSCLQAFDNVKPEEIDLSFSGGSQGLPFTVPASGAQRVIVCGSGTATLLTNGFCIGYVTFEVLYDLKGPDGISQLSAQVVARNVSGTAIDKPYAPIELHKFDLRKGPVTVNTSVNGSPISSQVVKLQQPISGTEPN